MPAPVRRGFSRGRLSLRGTGDHTVHPSFASPTVAEALNALLDETVFAALFVPLAATLYLAVSTSWSLGERALLRRLVINKA